MISKLIERPIAVTMSVIAIVILGAVAIGMIPVSLMPDIEIPKVSVQVNYPGATSREIESTVVTPLIRQLSQISALKRIEGRSISGSGVISLEFEPKSDINLVFIEVNEKVDKVVSSFPREVERPKVIKASAIDIPSFFINMTTKDSSEESMMQLSDFATEIVSKRLEQLKEVAFVDISGLTIPELIMVPDPQKSKILGIDEEFIRKAIAANNINLGSLTIKDDHYQWNIRFNANIKSREQIENIVINYDGRLLRIGDLVNISERPQSQFGEVYSDSQRAITFAIIKQSEAKMGDLKESLDGLMSNFSREYPDVSFKVTRDQTRLLEYSISNLQSNIFVAAFLAVIIIFLFMRDFRSPFLITITIPLSLIVSLLLFYVVGISINIISLSGLILGIGMMVDNSIIVIDSITQCWDRGLKLKDAVAKGVQEVFTPMLSSVLTTCAVFIPLIFLSGLSGALFFDQAMGVTIGLFSSLAVAVLVLPVYYNLMYKKQDRFKPNRVLSKLEVVDFIALYEKSLKWIFRHQVFVWIFVLLVFPSLVLLYTNIQKSKLPPITTEDAIVYLDWNSPVNNSENLRRVREILGRAESFAEHITIMSGVQQFMLTHTPELGVSESAVYIKCNSKERLDSALNKVEEVMKLTYPDSKFEVKEAANIFNVLFAENMPPLLAKVTSTEGGSPHPEELERLLSKVQTLVPNGYIPPVQWQEQISYVIDQESAARAGLDYNMILSALQRITSQNRVFTIMKGNHAMPVFVGEERGSADWILSGSVSNRDGVEIPLKEVIKEGMSRDLKSLSSDGRGGFYPVAIYMDQKEIPKAVESIKQSIRGEDKYEVSFEGSFFSGREMVAELIVVLIVAVLLLYFILAAQFESFVQPVIILSEVVIDIFGALLVLKIFGSGLNIMSMIGLVVMCGIIINDSILKVDTINRLRAEGFSLLRAIMEGGKRRLKPIIMTSLTTIFALIPFLSRGDMGSDLQFPLSLAIIGGMVVGTIVSLLFIPLAYYVIYKKR